MLFCISSFSGAGEVWFSLESTTYQNNNIVTLEEIGEGDDNALLCMTNLTTCCQSSGTGEMGNAIGNWYFPNGSRVPNSGTHFFSEAEVRWQYICSAKEVERKGSTAVRYLIQ